MMKLVVIVLLLAVYCPPTWATTCDECKTAYKATTAAKCAALKTYLQCLEDSGKADTWCRLLATDATAINNNFTANSCNKSFTDTCICQKDFWKTDQKGDAETCSASKNYITCLKGKTALACDGTTSVTALATGVETRMKALKTPACSVTSTCQCEIDDAKRDISTDAKNCTALTALKTCLSAIATKNETGCSTLTQAVLLTATNTKITAAKCGSEHVTIAVTSLIVSVVTSMFL